MISALAPVKSAISMDNTARLKVVWENGVLTGKGLSYGGDFGAPGGHWLRRDVLPQ